MPVNKNVMHFLSASHAFWYQVSGGVIGSRLAGMPVLLLTTTGRKSGRKRTTPLTHLRDGDNYILIASNAGHDTHPGWYHNLRSNPDAEIMIGREKVFVQAEAATGAERDRLYAKAVEANKDYAEYQKGTARKIPVVVLKPTT
jgi:deazaflavin-dependent oxidoreductase (nitroreductase family)